VRSLVLRASAPSATQASVRTYAAAAGQRATITLSDGSHVVLASGSFLRVPAGFGAHTREVELEGEAYFTVMHDAAQPFTVHTAHAVARDIGTAFNVRAYPELPTVEVAVTDGVVALSRARTAVLSQGTQAEAASDHTPASIDTIVLRASDLGRVGANGQLSAERQIDVAARVAWTTGQLVFDGQPLADVVPALARWYDLDIHLADPALGGRRLTTTLRGEPADVALNRIALALDLQVERAGRVVTFSARGSGQAGAGIR
jgi:ferric-dicitrate binding protein FerR (iron transport regulator)